MRNLLKLVFQRVVAVSFGIALQIIFLIVMATYLRTDFFWIRIAMNVLSWAVVIYIISCGVNPSYKIAWIVLILAFPVAGLTIYLLFGGNKISSYEHRKMQSIEAVTMQQLRQDEAPLWELAAAETPAFNHARYLLSASRLPHLRRRGRGVFPERRKLLRCDAGGDQKGGALYFHRVLHHRHRQDVGPHAGASAPKGGGRRRRARRIR